MNNSESKELFYGKDRKESELSVLKSKIVDTIRSSEGSERYWMIYKKKTFGLATIIDLTYKKIYIEILFFTNEDVLKRGIPLVKIYTPTETKFDFNEVLVDPDFDEDGLINPMKIIKRVNNIIDNEVNYHLTVLDNEIQLLNENFENYLIDNIPYQRKILIYFPNYVVKLRIVLENYPDIPRLSEKKQLIIKRFKEPLMDKIKEKFITLYLDSSIVRLGKEIKIYDDKEEIIIEKRSETFYEKFRKKIVYKLLKRRDDNGTREYSDIEHIIRERNFNNMDIIKNWNIEKPPQIIDVIESIINVKKGSQHLVLNNVSIIDKLYNITFKIHRGQSLGIYTDEGEMDRFSSEQAINKLFRAILGEATNYSGDISVFGREFQPEFKNELEGIFLASQDIDPKLESLPIKKALLHNIYIIGKLKSKKRLLRNVLEATGLLNRKQEKIANLTKLERLLFSISRALVTLQKIIMVSIPISKLGRLESEQFNRYVDKIKRQFHVILIIHGPKDIVSNCDQIITFKDKNAELGTIKHFISKLPQSGEIITIELNNPNKDTLDKMLKIDSAIFIEERKKERYKIYCIKDNPEKIINKLMNSIGRYVYSFKRRKATLEDYLEFSKISKNTF